MRQHTYTVAVGNEVPTQFHGQNVTFQRAETVEEALASGFYENAEALVSAAEQQRLIAIRAACRTELGRKPDEKNPTPPTLESAAKAGNAVKLGAPREAAEQKPKTPKAKAQAAAKTAGSSLFERMAADAAFEARLRKLDAATGEAFDAWKAALAEIPATPTAQPTV